MSDFDGQEQFPHDPSPDRNPSLALPMQIEQGGQVFLYHQTLAFSDYSDPDSFTGRSMAFRRSVVQQLTVRGVLATPGVGLDTESAIDGQVVVYVKQNVPQAAVLDIEEELWQAVQPLREEPSAIGLRVAEEVAALEQTAAYIEVFQG